MDVRAILWLLVGVVSVFRGSHKLRLKVTKIHLLLLHLASQILCCGTEKMINALYGFVLRPHKFGDRLKKILNSISVQNFRKPLYNASVLACVGTYRWQEKAGRCQLAISIPSPMGEHSREGVARGL